MPQSSAPLAPSLRRSGTPHPAWRTTIHDAFDGVASRSPRAAAIDHDGRSRSYADLAAASRRMAARLAAAGVTGGDVVGVCVGRSPEFVVAILAILRCGAAYAPLPTDYPPRRLAGMVEDARVGVIVGDRASETIVAALRSERPGLVEVPIDAEAAWRDDPPAGRPSAPVVGPDDPAYVMFTSGSTGRPRGVVVPHRAVTGLVLGQSFADFGPGLRTLLLAPTAFDASTFETWAPLLHGGTLSIFPDGEFDPVRLGEVLRAGRVNCLWLTAGLFNLVVDLEPTALAGVAHVLTGGDVLSVAHVRRAFAALPGIRITNGYGPTETTTFACTHAIDPEDPFPDGTIPIGRPLAHTGCVVVDERGEPVADGVEGELWIGGSGVALGYLPEDRTRFVADPHGRGDGLWYRSGDRCRRRPDGTFVFLGRVDRQVKIRGHRVEPAELEAALATHPAVRAAAAVPCGEHGDVSLGVAVVRRDGRTAAIDGLRDWLAERLQPALLPARIVFAPALPVTPNGKVDRDAIRELLSRATRSGRSESRIDARRGILDAFNDTAIDLGPPATLQALIEVQARLHPEAVAVEFEGATISYGELWTRACRLASVLRAGGAAADVPVAICAERSIEMVVGLVGILVAGAPYLPLDPEQPSSRLARMAAIAGARILLAQRRFLEKIPGIAAEAIPLDDPAAPWNRHEPGDAGLSSAALPGSPVDVAYVIFTSGSTGEPKGVMNTHAGIVNRLRWMQAAYDIGPGDRILQKTPYGFDVSVWEFFWPLLTGARLVVAPPGAHRDPRAIADLVRAAGITVIHFVPSMLDAFLELPDLEAACGSLRHLVTSGEALSERSARLAVRRIPSRLHNLYGPTEAAVDATFHEFHADDPGGPVPIGRPIANMRAYVLDADRRPAEVGETGELWLAGIGVAKGYVGRPDLTAELFLPDPFHGGTMYRTGDLARWRPDGAIEYLGRTDHQVKIGGVRVELGEIEAAIAAVDPGARAAVVAVRRDGAGDAALVAYVVGGTSIDERTFHDRLATVLPRSMVPSRIVSLPAFPVNANGKLDRSALPVPGARVSRLPGEPPRGPMEAMLAGLWQELLGLGAVGRDEDFFDAGGNSLLAMRFVARIEADSGFRPPVRAVFDHPRLADLAAVIGAAMPRSVGPLPAEPSGTCPAPIDLPALPAQRGMWVLQQLLPDTATYNQPFAFRPRGPIDPGDVRRRLEAAMIRHPALRTALVESEGVLVQRIAPIGGMEVPWQEDPTVGPERIEAALVGRSREPFDLDVAPLWRVIHFPAAAPHGVLLLLFHHAIIDDWSIGLLLDEFAADPAPTAPASRAILPSGGDRDAARAHWRRVLDGVPRAVSWPTGIAASGPVTGRGAVMRFSVPAEVVAAWERIARSRRATLFHAWLGACHAWIRRATGDRDAVVLTPLANRSGVGTLDAVGCLVNTLPIRLPPLADDATAADVTSAARSAFLDAIDHGWLPFDEIVACVPGAAGACLQPLGNVAFVLLERAGGEPILAGTPLERIDVHTGTARFDLTLTLFSGPAGGDAEGVAEYALDLLDEASVRSLVAGFVDLLAAVAADPSTVVGGAMTTPPDAPARPAARRAAETPDTEQEPPRGGTEAMVARLWSELLDVEDVRRQDRFFDLGGSSLSAVRFVHALARETGVRIPVRAVFVTPRLLDIAALVDMSTAAGIEPLNPAPLPGAIRSSLVPLQPLGTRPPLVLLPGVGGGIVHFRPLATALGPENPVYAALGAALDGPAVADETFERMVQRHADEVMAAFPGPGVVHLGGLSIGGWTAYEVARVLRSRGREVGTVVLFDTHPCARLPLAGGIATLPTVIANGIARRSGWIRTLSRGRAPRHLRRVLASVGLATPPTPPAAVGIDHRQDPLVGLVRSHRTAPYGGRVDLVLAEGNRRRLLIRHWRWLTGRRLLVHTTPFAHADVDSAESSTFLAGTLRAILDEVDAAGRDGHAAEAPSPRHR